MTRILQFFLLMLCFVFSASAQSKAQKSTTVTLSANSGQAVYMGSYTQEFGIWTLVLADGEQVVANIDIFANSAKRLAGIYTFDDATITDGVVLSGGTEDTLGSGSFTLSYVGKGQNYPVYHIEGVLQDVAGNTFLLNSDVEMLAYDYLFYLYYEMGAVDFDSCIVQLQDAPDEDTGVVVEMDFVGGNWEDLIASMGILKVTAETADGRYTQLLFDAEELKSGSYVINDLYASYCYIANLETMEYEAYFKSGTAEITFYDDGILSLTATMKAKNGDVYILRIPVVVGEGKDFHDYMGIYMPITDRPTVNHPALNNKILQGSRVIIEQGGRRFTSEGIRLR